MLDSQVPVESENGFVPFVFANPRTKKADKVISVSLAFEVSARRAQVEGVSFHTLRHTAVSRMVAAGVPDRIIMKIVGHTTPNMVSRYAHLAPDTFEGSCGSPGRKRSYTCRTKRKAGSGWRRPLVTPSLRGGLEVAAGFEPAYNGFANRPLRPLGYATLRSPPPRVPIAEREV